jgi:hypothetical protein
MVGQDVETLALSRRYVTDQTKAPGNGNCDVEIWGVACSIAACRPPFLSPIRYYLLLLGCVPINPLGYIPYNMAHGISFVS